MMLRADGRAVRCEAHKRWAVAVVGPGSDRLRVVKRTDKPDAVKAATSANVRAGRLTYVFNLRTGALVCTVTPDGLVRAAHRLNM